MQLQRRLNQFRSAQAHRTKIPEVVWHAAVELARQHRLNAVAHPLRFDFVALKPPSGKVSKREEKRKTTSAGFVELITSHLCRNGVHDRFESKNGGKMRIRWKGIKGARLWKSSSRLAGSGEMLHITAQMRVLVAIEAV